MIYVLKVFSESDFGETVFIGNPKEMTEDDLIKMAEENSADWYEAGAYPIIMIGKAPFGIYPIVDEIQWFEYDRTTKNYNKIIRPKKFDGFAFMV